MFGAGARSWKTTTAAIAAAVSAIGAAVNAELDNDPETVANWMEVATVVIFAFGLLFARDADKSTEESVVKKG